MHWLLQYDDQRRISLRQFSKDVKDINQCCKNIVNMLINCILLCILLAWWWRLNTRQEPYMSVVHLQFPGVYLVLAEHNALRFNKQAVKERLLHGGHFGNDLLAYNSKLAKSSHPLTSKAISIQVIYICTCHGRCFIVAFAKLYTNEVITFTYISSTYITKFRSHDFINRRMSF